MQALHRGGDVRGGLGVGGALAVLLAGLLHAGQGAWLAGAALAWLAGVAAWRWMAASPARRAAELEMWVGPPATRGRVFARPDAELVSRHEVVLPERLRPVCANTARYGALLVHVRPDVMDDRLLRDTAALANLNGARLIGVSTPAVDASNLGPLEERAVHLLLDAAGERFAEATSGVHAGAWWNTAMTPAVEAVARLQWAADLVVVDLSRPADAWIKRRVLRRFMDRTQRALLIRADDARGLRFSRAVVLWDGSASCERAVHAALPMLGRTTEVHVFQDRRANGRRRASAADLVSGLERRNISVRTPGCDAAEERSTWPDLKPDFVVLSGRSRSAEASLGEILKGCAPYAVVSG